ncbi:hypothetical protein ACFZBU_02350 [Embleya sp. NPDC008237]
MRPTRRTRHEDGTAARGSVQHGELTSITIASHAGRSAVPVREYSRSA